MNSVRVFRKLTRVHQALLTGAGAWVTSLLSPEPNLLSPRRLAVAAVMFFALLGASLFHFGAAKQVYARKHWDRLPIKHPRFLTALGLTFMSLSVAIAGWKLPLAVFWITLGDAVIIILYARYLSRHWATKNIVIAWVCTTTILLGSLSMSIHHPLIPAASVTIFFAYWAREILKDVEDIRANQGIRVTLPIAFTTHRALDVAAVMLGIAAFGAVISLYTVRASSAASLLIVVIGLMYIYSLWRIRRADDPTHYEQWISTASWLWILVVITQIPRH